MKTVTFPYHRGTEKDALLLNVTGRVFERYASACMLMEFLVEAGIKPFVAFSIPEDLDLEKNPSLKNMLDRFTENQDDAAVGLCSYVVTPPELWDALRWKRAAKEMRQHYYDTGDRTFYERYLKSEAWKERRELMIASVEQSCLKCNTGKNLEVHHMSYKTLFEEDEKDLEVLCRSCHKEEHEQA